jgi:hypothetical protein
MIITCQENKSEYLVDFFCSASNIALSTLIHNKMDEAFGRERAQKEMS